MADRKKWGCYLVHLVGIGLVSVGDVLDVLRGVRGISKRGGIRGWLGKAWLRFSVQGGLIVFASHFGGLAQAMVKPDGLTNLGVGRQQDKSRGNKGLRNGLVASEYFVDTFFPNFSSDNGLSSINNFSSQLFNGLDRPDSLSSGLSGNNGVYNGVYSLGYNFSMGAVSSTDGSSNSFSNEGGTGASNEESNKESDESRAFFRPPKFYRFRDSFRDGSRDLEGGNGNTGYRYTERYMVRYRVRSGDTLSYIARKSGQSLEEILRLNPEIKNADLIFPGQLIRLRRVDRMELETELETQGDSKLSFNQIFINKLDESLDQFFSEPFRERGDEFSSDRTEVYYRWPTMGVITSRFGAPRGVRTHRGIDIANAVGTPIYAAAAGRVVFSGWNPHGYGNLVVISHGNGEQTYYAHNSRNWVQQGQWVEAGQWIADMGSTGYSTGSHLHFEIRRNGQAINPVLKLALNKPR